MTSDFLEDAARQLAPLADAGSGLEARVRIDIAGEGSLTVELGAKTGRVRAGGGAADAAIALAPDVFSALMRGETDPQTVFRRGRMRISGDVATAIAVTRYLRARGIALADEAAS